MIYSGGFAALLDANVLYPAPLRDFLLHLAAAGLFKPKWSRQIQNEWIDHLLINRPDLTKLKLAKTQEAMDDAFADANISNYEDLIIGLSLPDENDRHVLAAAIKGNADVIITLNLKDFPSKYLTKFDIEVQHPDDFVQNLISLDPDAARKAFENQIRNLKNPPMSDIQLLKKLAECGLKKSAALLSN